MRIDLDRETVPFEGQFTVRITFPGDCFAGDFPGSDQYRVVTDQTDTVLKLGKVSIDRFSSRAQRQTAGYDQRRTVVLQPLISGVIAIEPILVRCGGGNEKTFRRTIRVQGGPARLVKLPADAPRQALAPEADFLGKTVGLQSFPGPQAQGQTLSGKGVESPVVTQEPAAAQPKNTSLAEAEEMDRRFSVRFLNFKSAMARSLTPGGWRVLRLAAVAVFAAGALVLLLPWKALKDWWRAQGRKAFTRKPGLPSISILRETDLIGGKYKIEYEIGSGGMSRVYRAQDIKLTRAVAVKKMRVELQFSPEERGNFIKEAVTISRLSHPFIVAIHEIIEQDGEIYMILDFVDGKPLSLLIDQKKGMSLKACQSILSNVCQAVDFAHKKNVLHQDLKPSNIMVDESGFAKVMDFGLARDEKVSSDDVLGTQAYMAPERHRGAGSAASDIYSLGVTLYEMLAERIPFPGPQFLAQKEAMSCVPLTQLRPDLPKGIDAVLAWALAPDPKDRISGALEFLERLNKL